MDRRRFVAGVATGGIAGLAGCGAGSATRRPPRVPEEQLESGGWVQTDRLSRQLFEREFAGRTVTAEAVTRLFEDRQLSESISEKSLGQVQGTLAQLFATRAVADPNVADLPGGVGRDELVAQVRSRAEERFKRRLSSAGLEDVGEVGRESMSVETGETAERTDYEATFAIDSLTFPVSDGQAIEIEGAALTVRGHLAVWIHGDGILISGGAYPGENFRREVDEQLSSAISVSVEVDMGLTPAAYRSELLGLIRQVS